MTTLIMATAAEVWTTIGYVLLGLVCLMAMVVIHEFGHYIAGKLLGFKINEFSIGFGPRIFKLTNKKSGEIFSIRPFPLGGFCQFEGEDEDGSDKEGSFNAQAPWKRLIVLFSGALFNFISALILITIIFTAFGQLLPTVARIEEESYIARQGILKEGDVIIGINGKNVNILMQDDISRAFARIEDEGTFTILRNGKKMTVNVKKSQIYERDTDGNIVYDQNSGEAKTRYAFGFMSGLQYVKLNFFTALGRSFSYGFFVVAKILWLLGQLVTGKLNFVESAGGPVTIISTMTDAGKAGPQALLTVVCLISANLAVMNLLPLPALDGSRMVFTIIEWIFHKPVNRKVEAIIHTVGLVLLFAVAVFADVMHLIG